MELAKVKTSRRLGLKVETGSFERMAAVAIHSLPFHSPLNLEVEPNEN